MTVSTDGQICYGILFDEDTEFPWDNDKFDGDIDDWWIYGILGFKHSFDGKRPSEEIISKYYEERREFEKINKKIPIKLVNYCSSDYPMYIIALPDTCNSSSRGYPKIFNPVELIVTSEQKSVLVDFCNEHKINFVSEPAWYLSSYWG